MEGVVTDAAVETLEPVGRPPSSAQAVTIMRNDATTLSPTRKGNTSLECRRRAGPRQGRVSGLDSKLRATLRN